MFTSTRLAWLEANEIAPLLTLRASPPTRGINTVCLHYFVKRTNTCVSDATLNLKRLFFLSVPHRGRRIRPKVGYYGKKRKIKRKDRPAGRGEVCPLFSKHENGHALVQNGLFGAAYHAHSAISGCYRRYRICRGRRRRSARRG